jgi:hypothetical protein
MSKKSAAKKVETEITKEGEPSIEVVPPTPKVAKRFELVFKMFCENIEADESFEWLATVEDSPNCGVFLADGSDVPCYAVAECELGNYTVLTTKGVIKQYLADEVS